MIRKKKIIIVLQATDLRRYWINLCSAGFLSAGLLRAFTDSSYFSGTGVPWTTALVHGMSLKNSNQGGSPTELYPRKITPGAERLHRNVTGGNETRQVVAMVTAQATIRICTGAEVSKLLLERALQATRLCCNYSVLS